MFTTRTGLWLLAASVCLLLVAVTTVGAECNATLNLRSGTVHQGPVVGWGEVRFWDGDGNETFTVGVTAAAAKRWDWTVMYLDMDVAGEDPAGNAVRASVLKLLAADLRWQLREDSWLVALNPGLEFAIGDATGTNTATGASADWGDTIPTLGVICERHSGPWTWIINPKAAFWPSSREATNGQVVEGFGTVLGVGLGVRHQTSDRLQLMADITPIVSGDNAINENSNRVERALVWGVGASYLIFPQHNSWLTLFGSNAFGPTPATSLLATPDDSICFGARLTTQF